MRERYSVTVQWADCDPAGIVFYPNFYRWFDSAFHTMLKRRGLDQRELFRRYGIVGTVLAGTGASFKAPATYGDTIHVESAVERWTERSFTVGYTVLKDGAEIVTGHETRVFAKEDPANGRMSGMPIPESFKAILSGPPTIER